MATIDSLDLATLTNNPQSIAEALEDALETTSGTLGSLKSSAQADHDAIEDLKESAQEDHDAIESLFNSSNSATRVQYTSLGGSFIIFNTHSSTSSDGGVIVQNLGKIWIVNIQIKNSNPGSTEGTTTLINLGTDFTHPGGTVICGGQHFGDSSQNDYSSNVQIKSNGDIDLFWKNVSGTSMTICGNFIGFDVS